MRLRKVSMAAAAVVAAILVAACGSNDPAPVTSVAPLAPTGTTTAPTTAAGSVAASENASVGVVDPNAGLVIWVDTKQYPALKAAGDKFGTANGVTVSVQSVANLRTAFLNASQGGTAPDIILGAHDWIGELVQNGAIKPVQLDSATQAKFDPLAIKGVSFNGQIYGVPFDFNNVVLFRNTELAPTAPTSIEDMVTQGKALVAAGKAKEVLGLPIGPNGDAYHMYPFFTSSGAYLFGKTANGDYNPKDLGLAKPEAQAAMAKISQLGKEGVLKTSIDGSKIPSIFTSKDTAFMISGPWNYPDVKKSGVPFDISPVPGFGGNPAKPFVTVDALYVAAKGKHVTVAEEFALNYFATKEVALALYDLDPRPPALIEAAKEAAAKDPLVQKTIDAGKNGDIMPANPEMASVWDPWGKAESAVVGGADPTATLNAAVTAIQAAINK
jgi:arabinogalactan oligomer / maltooligosaccharide transport system substrate-binding protein